MVGEAGDGRQAVELAEKLHPDVVVMDIAMSVLNGLAATRQIVKAVPATKVMILSAHSDDEYIAQVSAIGARGYVTKQAPIQVLCRAIREIAKGRRFFSPCVARRLRLLSRTPPGASESGRPEPARLSAREVEVLQLIAEGRANKQIAAELDISIKTVEKHRQHVMDKLAIHDTAGLTRDPVAAIADRGGPRGGDSRSGSLRDR